MHLANTLQKGLFILLEAALAGSREVCCFCSAPLVITQLPAPLTYRGAWEPLSCSVPRQKRKQGVW